MLMALDSTPVSGHRWTFRHYQVTALAGCVIIVWEWEKPSVRIHHTLAEVVARAHKFEVNGSHECAEIMRLAAAYAWHDVVTVADDSAPLSLAVC